MAAAWARLAGAGAGAGTLVAVAGTQGVEVLDLSCPGGLVEGTCQVLDPGLGIRRVGVSSPGEEAGGREAQMASVRASA